MSLSLLKQQVETLLDSKGCYFISSILTLCRIVKTEEDTVAYVSPVQGLTIFLGKGFFDLTYREKQGVILHEVLHIPQLKEMQYFTFDYSKPESKLPRLKDKFSRLFKVFENQAQNYGLDAEVNQTVERLGFALPEGCILPENLQKALKSQEPAPKRGCDFVEFVQYCIDNMPLPEDKEDSEGEGEEGSALKDAIDRLIEEASEKALEKAKQGGQDAQDAKLCGRTTGKNLMKEKPALKIPKGVIKELEVVKRRLKAVRGEKRVFAYTWSRRHKSFPNKILPRLQEEKFIKRTEKVVVVMDSSGSAWSERNFKLGLSIVDWFEKQGFLGGFYCCDTELFKVEKDKRSFSEVVGGGGTEFDKRHVNTIVSDIGEDISILYLTDGELDLSDANERKDTHVLVCF